MMSKSTSELDMESRFRSWSKPPGISEAERCENARRIVSETLHAAPELEGLDVVVFAQGSFRNNTNIVGESDVDICVRTERFNFADLGAVPLTSLPDVGLVPAQYTYREFKQAVATVLKRRFGTGCVPGDKAIAIHANTYRVDADVIACFEGRRYERSASGMLQYQSGSAFIPDSSARPVYNWPEHHLRNGIAKNEATGRRFKFVARILKTLRLELLPPPLKDTPSFLVECLVFNAPDTYFGADSYTNDVRTVLAWIHEELASKPHSFLEVNRMKPLFGAGQPWTVDQAKKFVLASAAIAFKTGT